MNDPPFYSLTQHALDQATAMGIDPDDVRRVIARPLVDHPSETSADCRLAHDGRIKAVYNPAERSVITVLWVSHEWLPDRHLPPEQQVSGWINLDAKAAEKVLTDWGFVIDSQKDTSNLWTHPDDLEKRLIPFSIPSRGARANGKGSFRTAAQVVGVPVARFVKGRDEDALAELRRKRQLAEIRDATAAMDSPNDPFGITQRAAAQKIDRIKSELTYPTPLPPATASPEPTMPTMTATDEKVLAALVEQHTPTASYALAAAVGLTDRQVRESLRKLEKEELAYRVGFAPSRAGAGRGGAPASLWWHAETYEATPDPAPEPTPDPTPTAPQEHDMAQLSPVPAAAETIVLPDAKPTPKIFTETGTPWPTGGLLIQDEDGVFYVARRLVEEGR